MSVVRRFLVLPALARLVRKERGGSKITEGYFAPQGGRTSLVRIDGQHCHLVLIKAGADGVASEERTEVPRAHGDALLDVCGGKAVYERTTLSLSPGREIQLDRYTTPTGLDLISVPFEDENASKSFRVPIWFGTEVTTDGAYDRHAIALQGPPEPARLNLNNAMLDAVLDLFEPRFGMGRFGASPTPASRQSEDEAARRPAGNGAAASLAGAEVPPSAAPAPPPGAKPPSAPEATGASQPAPTAATPAPEPAKPASEPAAKPPVAEVPPAAAKPAEPAANAPGKTPVEEPPEAKPPAPPAAQPEPKPAAAVAAQDGQKSDARIDDVIESLSQALGAAIQQPPEPAKSDDLAASFERWTVRPRRTQQ